MKLYKIILNCITPIGFAFLIGCSDSDELTDHQKITKYEMGIANEDADLIALEAKNLNITGESPRIPTFQDAPIPSSLKQHHSDLGLDTSTLIFGDSVEVAHAKDTNQKIINEANEYKKNNPPLEEDPHKH